MTLDEAKEAFYAEQTNVTASDYITEALQYFHDEMVTEMTVCRAAGEVAFWLKFGRLQTFPNE